MNEVILNSEDLAWLGKYGYTIDFNSEEDSYQVLGIDDRPLGGSGFSVTQAARRAIREYDTRFVDMMDETLGELYHELRQAFDEYAGRELSGGECLQLLKDLKAPNE